jgi:hypothetical protein
MGFIAVSHPVNYRQQNATFKKLDDLQVTGNRFTSHRPGSDAPFNCLLLPDCRAHFNPAIFSW